ncbi:MAG: hypothetical protein VB141_11300 [Burkholderia gladioli]
MNAPIPDSCTVAEFHSHLLDSAARALSWSESISDTFSLTSTLDVAVSGLTHIRQVLSDEAECAESLMSPEEKASGAPPLDEIYAVVLLISHHTLSLVDALYLDAKETALWIVTLILKEVVGRLSAMQEVGHA